MSPLMLYALIAGLAGWSFYKKWWGCLIFFGALLLWMLVIQICVAMSMHTVMD